MPIESPEALVVDFDGTLVNMDLGARFNRWITESGQTKRFSQFVRILGAPWNMIARKLELGVVVRAWSFRLTAIEIERLVVEFLNSISLECRINTALLVELQQSKVRKKVLLTGCPEEIVTSFLRIHDINVFDEVVGMRVRFGFVVRRHPYGRRKLWLSRKYGKYWAIGDSWPDRHLLMKADQAVIVSGNDKLTLLAKQLGWRETKFGEM